MEMSGQLIGWRGICCLYGDSAWEGSWRIARKCSQYETHCYLGQFFVTLILVC